MLIRTLFNMYYNYNKKDLEHLLKVWKERHKKQIHIYKYKENGCSDYKFGLFVGSKKEFATNSWVISPEAKIVKSWCVTKYYSMQANVVWLELEQELKLIEMNEDFH